MKAEVVPIWEALEARRKRLVDRALAVIPERQTARPNSKSWSPAEVIDHLAASEILYMIWMDKTPADEIAGVKAKRNFPYRMVLWTLRKAIRVPTMKDMEPHPDITMAEAVENWEDARRRLRDRFEGRGLDEVILKHPLFGPTSVRQILEVFDAHMGYHETHFPA